MQAWELMTSKVLTIGPEATVGDAVDLMLTHDISCVPVLDDQNSLVGILTHTDFGLHRKFLPLADTQLYTLLGSWITPKAMEETIKEIRRKKIKDTMSHPVITVQASAPASTVVELMLDRDIHRLPVINDKELVGIITRHDLIKLMASTE